MNADLSASIQRTGADRPGLLEREHQLADLDRLIDDAVAGQGRAAVVTGPPGGGKTAVLDLVAIRAEERGCAVRRARSSVLEQEFGLGAALQLFEGIDAALLDDGAARLARPLLLPDDHGVPGESFSIMHGLYWLTVNLAARGPVALLIDDAQWCDAPTLRFAAYLAARLDGMPVVLVLGVRGKAASAGEEVRSVLTAKSSRTLDLPPLTVSGVATLLERSAGPDAARLAEVCHSITGGNPLLVNEVAREIASGSAAPGADSPGAPSDEAREPPGDAVLRSLVTRRLDGLDDNARSLAEVIAVTGGGPMALLTAVAGLDPQAARSALVSLQGAGLAGPGDPVRPAHDLLRDAVDALIPTDRRAHLHAAALGALHTRGASVEAMAVHARAMAPQGSDLAVAVLRRTAHRALTEAAPRRAVVDLRCALTQGPGPHERGLCLAELARAEALAGDDCWRAHIDEAVALGSGAGRAARARRRLADALYAVGELRDAAHQYELGLAALDDPTSDLALRLLAGLSQSTLVDVTKENTVLPQVEAVVKGGAALDSSAHRDLMRHYAYALAIGHGTREEVLGLAHRSMSIEDGASRFVPSLVSGMLALQFADDDHLLPALIDHGIHAAQERGDLAALAGLSNYRGAGRLARAEIDAAIADLTLARTALGGGSAGLLPTARAHLALCYLERDDPEEAERAIQQLDDPSRYARSATLNAWLRARGEVRATRGDLAGALEDLGECGRREQQMGSLNPATIPWEFSTARLLATVGRHREARPLLESALAQARRFGAPRTLAHGLRAAAVLEQGARRVELLVEAGSLVSGTPWRLEAAEVALALGRELVAQGKRREGQAQLREALDLTHGRGAVRLSGAAARALRASGARPRRMRTTGPEALTPTERIVAEMAASGLTNRQIAEQRFVTVKAVEYHLANAFRKLSVRSRAELGPALAGQASEA